MSIEDANAGDTKTAATPRKEWYKKKRFIIPISLLVLSIFGSALGGNEKKPETTAQSTTSSTPASPQPTTPAQPTSPSPSATATTPTPPPAEPAKSTANSQNSSEKIPDEGLAALAKAQTYSDTMHLSKRGLYDQLVSEHGEKFPPAAAAYAVKMVNANWNENALHKARTYRDTMHMSKNAILDQLTSDHGEKFTKSEAQYAVKNM